MLPFLRVFSIKMPGFRRLGKRENHLGFAERFADVENHTGSEDSDCSVKWARREKSFAIGREEIVITYL